MNPENAILTISLFAAFADGANDDREREHIRRFAETLGSDAPDLPCLYQDVLLRRVKLSDATKALGELGQRQFAYEMAVCVCDADGVQGDGERRFLAELKTLLALAGDRESSAFEHQADALADAASFMPARPAAPSRPAAAPAAPVAAQPSVSEAELDKSILNYSILNGALELLPQSWASVAIIPLQIKMVYRIGKAYGNELDQGHIKEFLATVGVGLTSQYLEQFGRKLLGGLLGKVAGKTVGGLGRAATGVAFSFATTYALGQVARRYYAGGRQMSTQLLQDTFQQLLGPAKQMQSQYLPQIEQKAGSLDAGQIMAMVRGNRL
ncbi:MAG: GTPase [Betaproteobacteria bacterium HGW-Betaproteobacteria-12]|nr:MAG: GTPase [Betaproteobacteria bacterium HGW-Betaproteobacteria-12]